MSASKQCFSALKSAHWCTHTPFALVCLAWVERLMMLNAQDRMLQAIGLSHKSWVRSDVWFIRSCNNPLSLLYLPPVPWEAHNQDMLLTNAFCTTVTCFLPLSDHYSIMYTWSAWSSWCCQLSVAWRYGRQKTWLWQEACGQTLSCSWLDDFVCTMIIDMQVPCGWWNSRLWTTMSGADYWDTEAVLSGEHIGNVTSQAA